MITSVLLMCYKMSLIHTLLILIKGIEDCITSTNYVFDCPY